MIKHIMTAVVCLLCMTAATHAQQNVMDNKYQKQWQRADSLTNKGLPQSAEKIVQNILQDAENKNDKPNIIKAKLTLMSLENIHSETSLTDNIKKAETEAGKTSGAEKAIWQSITAGMYWQYYQNNRWQVLDRTTLETTASDDIATWDAKALVQKTSDLYLASIAAGDILKKIPVEKYLPLIIEGKNTRNLRPTLYDLLVFLAIDFFSNDEKDITNPAYKFEIDSPVWFEEASKFSQVRMKIADAGSLHFKALQLYQDIIAFHLNDTKPDALVDADLQRLQFVYSNSVSADKDSLYLNTLQYIASKYAGNPAVAEAAFLIQQQLYINEPINTNNITDATQHKRNLPLIVQSLQKIIDQYPNTAGAADAYNLIQTIKQPVLTITTNKVIIPGNNIKALVQYKNVAHAYLSLYKINTDVKNYRNYSYNNKKAIEALPSSSLIKTWQQAFPASADMEQHSAEIKADALMPGSYILIIADKEDPLSDNSTSGYVQFQVSNLSLIANNENNKIYILNRDTGSPVSDVTVHFYRQEYNNRKQQYENILATTGYSNSKGIVTLPGSGNDPGYNNFSCILVIKDNDSLLIDNFYNHSYNNNDTGYGIHTFFFTDRSIYRPGQTIYFKGIIVKNNAKTGQSAVVPDTKTSVTFYDANDQKITAQSFTTNEFGSFSGTFTAPEGLLTGQMHITDDNGSAYFSVEEYKRPKFYVNFDTLKDDYALNRQITVKGFAKAYAGNNIDNAQVKYRVVRNARFPFYWSYYRWGMPSSPQMEIKNGTAATRADGSFAITFTTLPDKKINPQSLPVFSYTIYADVTDINGETRSSSILVNAGYRSLQVTADLPEDSAPGDLDSIRITTRNLNGQFIPATVNMSVAPLLYPGKLYQKRLWSQPDQYVMTESEFRKAFPDDEYKNESDYHNWKEQNAVFTKTLTTTEKGQVPLPENIFMHNGWYVITLKTKDVQGNDITEKKYTHVWNPENNERIQKDIVIQSNKSTYQPGDKAIVKMATAYGNPYLLYTSSLHDYHPDNYKKPLAFEKTITEADRGNITFSYLYIYHNRIYTVSETVQVPWSNKDLQIEWTTHRDKLLPGAQETWTMTIKGNKKETVAAEFLAGMYDASLDAFKPHTWQTDKLVPYRNAANIWEYNYGFGTAYPVNINHKNADYKKYEKQYDRFLWSGYNAIMRPGYNGGVMRSYANASYDVSAVAITGKAPGIVMETKREAMDSIAAPAPPPTMEDTSALAQHNADIPIRTNLNETAFFFPKLQTDSNGNVSFKFTMPEALTAWKLMAFAHTKDWKTGYLEGKIKTQKDLMVMPNLPRFFRQGDDMVITTKINSLADKDLAGVATLEILNAETMQPLDLPFRLQNAAQNFSVQKNQSTTASWNIHIPESIYTPVVVRITAHAGDFTDGEENTLPVITNRMLVTETLPMPVHGDEEKTFVLDKLKNSNSNTLVNHSLTVEFTANPAWYAVQALPYLMEYPYECAEQTFNRFYANALAAHIVAQSPKVAAVFNQWKNEDTAALLSNLSKNEELKSALLEETPWVMEAKDETEQKHRIAMLFETHKLAKELSKNLDKLSKMQLPEGGFPWFSGMRNDRYITQYILTGLARLQHLGVSFADKKEAQNIIDKAIPYLDHGLKNDYDNLIKYKAKLDEQQIAYSQIQYLYMRSFYNDIAVDKSSQKAFDYYKNQAAKYWSTFNPYMKGMIALALNRLNDTKSAGDIIASLKETAVHNEETGMYWKEMPNGYFWYEAPVESQSLLIEAFQEVAKDENAVDEMKAWLLKQKQTQNWQTTKATADACYALLLNGSDWLSNEPVVTISLGNVKTIKSDEIKTEAGTGYFKQRIDGKDVQPEMGTIKVKIQNEIQNPKPKIQNSVSWGAVYWQYFEDMDKITSAATPLSITKQLFIERNSDNGPVLTEIKDGNQLKVGDKVKVRLVLKTDRDMEYVHLKDMRGACFEPADVLSGYKYQGGLGYYQSTKDVSTNFFFDRISKGTYVFEYTVFVSQKGDFSNGIATIQCMYAPEFSSHSEGIRVKVE